MLNNVLRELDNSRILHSVNKGGPIGLHFLTQINAKIRFKFKALPIHILQRVTKKFCCILSQTFLALKRFHRFVLTDDSHYFLNLQNYTQLEQHYLLIVSSGVRIVYMLLPQEVNC